MAGLTPKIKEDLALFYDTDQFKSFQKFCNQKRDKIMRQLLSHDMSAPNSDKVVSMLQGQAHALEFLQLEIRKIHKDQMAKEYPKTPKKG
jgi:hypothetical protein